MRLISVTATGTATVVTKSHINAGLVVLQASGTCYIGDNTVTTSTGIPIVSTNPPLVLSESDNRIPLYEFYVIGSGTLNILWN